jgi:molybdopterin converting factor small subunit
MVVVSHEPARRREGDAMGVVRVRGALKERAGGSAEHHVEGATVAELLCGLEREHPALAGWILDERGRIRRHVNVFVNGERGGEGTAVARGDRVDVLPAISGG